MIQWSLGYDDPDLSICEAAGAWRGRWSQRLLVNQKGAWMKGEEEEEEEEGEEEQLRVQSYVKPRFLTVEFEK